MKIFIFPTELTIGGGGGMDLFKAALSKAVSASLPQW